jgi:hypothetical protein
MAIRMLCPNGHELITEDQYAGRKVRCPHCQVMLVVPKPAAQVQARPPRVEAEGAEDLEMLDEPDTSTDITIVEDEPPKPQRRRAIVGGGDDEPPPRRRQDIGSLEEAMVEAGDATEGPARKKKKKRKGAGSGMTRDQFAKVNLGLGVHYVKVICYLGGIFTLIGGVFAAFAAGAAGGGQSFAGVAMIVMLLATLLWVVLPPILGVIGSILCCWVHQKTGARTLILISMGLDVASLLMFGVFLILSAASMFNQQAAGSGIDVLALALRGASALLSLAAWVLFMVFLRNLAYFFDEQTTGDESVSVTITYLVSATFGLAAVVGLSIFLDALLPCIGAVFALVLIICYVIWMIKVLFRILNLIGSLRQVIRSRVGV